MRKDTLELLKSIQKNAGILADDMDPDRDFNKLFSQKCPALAKKYGTLDKALEQEILPKQGNNRVVSFSFDLSYKDAIKKSFENFFSESFAYFFI